MADLKFLYTSDIHGSMPKYNGLLKQAGIHKVDTIVNGADIFPKGGRSLLDQKKFILGPYKDYLKKCQDKGVKNYTMMGNDDLKTFENYFYELVDAGLAINLVGHNKVGDYNFVGYNYVPDYPFGLKDWCKKDSDRFVPERYISAPVISVNDLIVPIVDTHGSMDNFWSGRTTIEEDLGNIQIDDPRMTIFVCHCPPNIGKLDMCIDGRKVGSVAVSNFIRTHGFLLTLHGHIHEVVLYGDNSYKVEEGETTIVQLGQDEDLLTYAYVELSDDKVVKVERRSALVG